MPVQICPHCDYKRMPFEGIGENCPRCSKLYTETPVPRPIAVVIPTDPIEKAWYFRDFRSLSPEQLGLAAGRVEICTLESMPGKTIEQAVGLVSGTYTMAFGAIFEAFAGLARNIRGSGSSPQTEQYINEGILNVIVQLRVNAMMSFGADAVVGIKYQFEEFSGANNKGILAVIGTGTAVKYASNSNPKDTQTNA